MIRGLMRTLKTLLLLVSVLVVTVPFLNKPIHIDDTVVLWVTENILNDPLDPFAGEMDWSGHLMPLWESTTNPPFVSYYLAPFAAISDYSERVLHLAMIPFYLLMGWGMLWLSGRFGNRSGLPLLFLLSSCAVIVSGNVMRDVPGAALAAAGVALFIRGVDENKQLSAGFGTFLCGLALLAKYSAAITLPVLVLYALLQRRLYFLFWIFVPVAMLVLWCLHNQWIYGGVHIFYLLFERDAPSGIPWQDRFLEGLVVLGAILFLFPIALWEVIKHHRNLLLVFIGVASAATLLGVFSFYGSRVDWVFYVWAAAGVILLAVAAAQGLGEFSADDFFLLSWAVVIVGFSVVIIPFQAVRHLIPALPPLILILFRFLDGPGSRRDTPALSAARPKPLSSVFLVTLLIVQAAVGIAVQLADYEYAATYRDFASKIEEQKALEGQRIWYVGHWGWMFYAERAGLTQLHRDGPYPQSGDFLIWPRRVHIGDVFDENDVRSRLQLTRQTTYPARWPLRTMSLQTRAGFYATVRGLLPYRSAFDIPLEVIEIYRVGSAPSLHRH